MHMRTMILAAASVAALAGLGAAPAHAVGVRYPFCIQGDRYPGLSTCSYPSYQACMATASGIGQTCVANPYYAGDNDPRSYLHTRARERGDSFFDLFIH
ncbi:hypothetical protein QU42_10500 [Bradyrhizobium sp. UASWS1016]|nr:DUF3551 domain-containing protein [Bradyrhizobium sp. SK17]OCX31173.1 hypothetical protein QU42_10500 [Bradyrhizobium sp. UASWS1016]